MNITIIEEENILSSKISKILEINWFNTEIYNNHIDFKNKSLHNSDLFIIDISLTGLKWFDIITYLRKIRWINSPIIITSIHDESHKKIYWLNLGADDYLVKPFQNEELLARTKALIRRSYKTINYTIIKYKDIEYDVSNKILNKNWIEVNLTSNELKLIEFLLFNLWQLITKAQIINSVWWEHELTLVSDNTINVTISRVRKKLWKDFIFKTIINKWYILKK